MKTSAHLATNSSSVPARWPAPLTAREMDQQFPGMLDGIQILAGAANVIMQLSRSGVGYGVMESRVHSGNVFRHPVKRTRTTFTYLAVALLGTPEEKLAYRKAVNGVHAQVYSTEQSPVKYHALDPKLQLWVAACLYFGFADVNRQLGGRLNPEQAAAFYRQAAPLATTLQVRPEMWPADLDAFNTYWQAELEQRHIDATVRAYFNDLVDLKMLHPALSLPLRRFHRFVTAGFLPQRLREQMHYAWGPEQQRKFDRFLAVAGAINRSTPRVLRQLPFSLVLWDFRRRLRNGLPLV